MNKPITAPPKALVGSEALQELLINYVHANNLKGVTNCLAKGAHISAQSLTTAIYMQRFRMVKFLVANAAQLDWQSLVGMAEKLPNEKIIRLLKDKLLGL